MNKQNARFDHVHAVVRVDCPIDNDTPENSIMVVKVFTSEAEAEAEVERLNQLNDDKNCRYFRQITRMARPK